MNVTFPRFGSGFLCLAALGCGAAWGCETSGDSVFVGAVSGVDGSNGSMDAPDARVAITPDSGQALDGNGGADEGGKDDAGKESRPLTIVAYNQCDTMSHCGEGDTDALQAAADAGGNKLIVTTATAEINAATLQNADVLILSSPASLPFTDTQKAEIEAFVGRGGGLLAMHYGAFVPHVGKWEFYKHMMGGVLIQHHGLRQEASCVVERHDHPATASLPDIFPCYDDFMREYTGNPWESPHTWVLATVDDTSLDTSNRLITSGFPVDSKTKVSKHPIAWATEYGGGRGFFLTFGHGIKAFRPTPTSKEWRSWTIPMLNGAIRWLGRLDASPAL